MLRYIVGTASTTLFSQTIYLNLFCFNLEYDINTKKWTSNTNASHVGNLENLRPYNGSDHILVGNGDFLHITHIGDATIGSGSSWIILHNVLLVPELERNLLFIRQLTFDYIVNYEFSNNGFVIKDHVT